MCPGPKPPTITITITATTADPAPPTLSDGINTAPPGGDKDFTTVVVPDQTIKFVVGGDISGIASITEAKGSDIFSQDPTAANNWTAIVGTKLKNKDLKEYTICYNVNGAPANPYCQDPKLRMKK